MRARIAGYGRKMDLWYSRGCCIGRIRHLRSMGVSYVLPSVRTVGVEKRHIAPFLALGAVGLLPLSSPTTTLSTSSPNHPSIL